MLALKYRNSGIRVHTHSLDDKRATVKMSMSISFFMCTRTISFQAKKDIVHVFVLCRLSQQRRAASTVQRTHNQPKRMAKSHSHKIKRVFVRRSLFVACTSISISLFPSLYLSICSACLHSILYGTNLDHARLQMLWMADTLEMVFEERIFENRFKCHMFFGSSCGRKKTCGAENCLGVCWQITNECGTRKTQQPLLSDIGVGFVVVLFLHSSSHSHKPASASTPKSIQNLFSHDRWHNCFALRDTIHVRLVGQFLMIMWVHLPLLRSANNEWMLVRFFSREYLAFGHI